MMLTRSVSKVDLVRVSLPRNAYLRAPAKCCLAVLILVLFGASLCKAQGTFTAASCNRSDVNAVINGPTHTAVNGDTIIIPAGTCTWTSGITISGVGIDITGTGTPNIGPGTSGAGTPSATLINHANAPFFSFTGLTVGQTAKVELLSMSSSGASAFSVSAPVVFVGTCTASGCPQVRADNLNFVTGWNNGGSNPVISGGFFITVNVFGVIDHNTAAETGNALPLVQVHFPSWQGVGFYGDNSFASPSTFGTAQSLFLENNHLNDIRGTENDVSAGGNGEQNVGGLRVVCRFNTVVNMSGTGVCSAHGTAWGGRFRGQRQVEVYYNNVTIGGGCDSVNGLNSGTGYYFSNSISAPGGGCNKFLGLDIARFIMTGTPWNSCDGTQPWDQSPFSSSSQCLDQPGRGPGALLAGTETAPLLASALGTVCTTLGRCFPNPSLDPVYEAGEVMAAGGLGTPVVVASDGSSTRVLANRDYYAEVSQLAQSNPTTPFNGTTGTGYGTLANRPTTCTTGVGFWATDQGTWNQGGAGGVLYTCTSTNTWTSKYTPYTYPHPLTVGGTTTTGGNPSPPTNLTATVQ